jgi:hypothetical protein
MWRGSSGDEDSSISTEASGSGMRTEPDRCCSHPSPLIPLPVEGRGASGTLLDSVWQRGVAAPCSPGQTAFAEGVEFLETASTGVLILRRDSRRGPSGLAQDSDALPSWALPARPSLPAPDRSGRRTDFFLRRAFDLRRAFMGSQWVRRSEEIQLALDLRDDLGAEAAGFL